MTRAVEVIGVAKSFADVVALHSVDLAIEAGAFVSLLGASGCGKSTLLRIIAGFETPTAGNVLIHGKDVTGLPPHVRPTNMVFQRGALFPHMTVFDNVAYSLRLRRLPREAMRTRVEEMLALVRLDGLEGRMTSELSGGQAQRVALARALAAEPQVLLLDEPLSALDLKLRQQMQLELRAIQRKLGATFVFVTHDQTEALVMSDRIAVMERGRIAQFGTPREIYHRPSSLFVSDFIGQTNFLKGLVAGSEKETAVLRLADGQLVTGETAALLAPGAPATLSVRPEAIRIVDADGLGGTVAEVIYLGGSVRLGVQAADSMLWVDLRDEEAASLAPGAPVRLAWKPAAATVWAGEG